MVKGKIQWISEKPKEFPKDSGEFSIGMKVKENFYNIYNKKESLEEVLKTLKKGYEVDLNVEGNKIVSFEILSTEIEQEKEHFDDSTNFEALLNDAHSKFGDKMNIKTELISVDYEKHQAIFSAGVSVEYSPEKVRVFTAHGDAEGIKSELIKPHFIRMAETRAIARALRWATNNAKVAEEEK